MTRKNPLMPSKRVFHLSNMPSVLRGVRFQDGQEAGIEDPFQNENDDIHGLIGIKNVNRANIPAEASSVQSGQSPHAG
jgi:hypothetical protein